MAEEEWHNQRVAGKDVEKGLSEPTKAKLHSALHLQPGQVPNTIWDWEEVLGHEKPKIVASTANAKTNPSLTATPSGYINGTDAANATTVGSEAIRPKRVGRKRRYDDYSFEGYGEGYVDDDAEIVEGDGDSSGDGGSTAKKRKKVNFLQNSTHLLLMSLVFQGLRSFESHPQ